MRHAVILLTSLFLLAIPTHVGAEEQKDEPEGPGDNFDLTGALNAFSEAKSLEAFEKTINDTDSQINNLDLNEDDEVDYVRVVEQVEGQTHVFILRVPISEKEEQDIATIEVEKLGEEDITAQIVGDEDIYGPDYIIEPDETAKAHWRPRGDFVLLASAGDDWSDFVPKQIEGNGLEEPYDVALLVVFRWPIVPLLFAAAYSPWVSPYYWGYWPPYWSAWRPVAFGVWGVRRVAWHRAVWRHTAVRRSVHARNIHRAHHRSSAHARHHSSSRHGDRAGGKDRAGGGDRVGSTDRKAGGDRQAATSRDRQGSSTSSRDRASTGSRDRPSGSSASRQATSRSSSSQASRSRSNGSFGGYSRSSGSHSSRGSRSRWGGGRGGGGRGGGGRRR